MQLAIYIYIYIRIVVFVNALEYVASERAGSSHRFREMDALHSLARAPQQPPECQNPNRNPEMSTAEP